MNREQRIINLALSQARRLREVYGQPQVIGLSIYATDEDLRQLRPEDGPEATTAQQRRITEAVAEALRADGHIIKLVTLRVVDYLQWLSEKGKDNTAASRAEWVNWNTTRCHGNTGKKNAAKPLDEQLAESRTIRFKKSEISAMKQACISRKKEGKTMPLRVFIRLACCREAGHELPDLEPESW